MLPDRAIVPHGGPEMSGLVAVEWVTADAVRPLRADVLRPGSPVSESAVAGDDDPRAAHAAVRGPEGVIACGSVLPEPAPWDNTGGPAWRIRGMATVESRRGGGLGRVVLAALLGHVAEHGGGLVWCNARLGAGHLYARAGFAARGDVFELPEIGPHRQMWRDVDAAEPGADRPRRRRPRGGPKTDR